MSLPGTLVCVLETLKKRFLERLIGGAHHVLGGGGGVKRVDDFAEARELNQNPQREREGEREREATSKNTGLFRGR